mmetsp:Transcript_5961/g.12448  ORF Transcript_5961/g.12448 Transcript_5961/m.12448 type:complete len:227 (-) Transcript_5961:187-867(-)|eukprot:CAMPEP_0183309392 /NCGR_PEP_ID=MMETSP0160_2-20130417/25300_1 /TAXON_ID=2839 ORGANISM="Odontella Sinensis, Strain Grunow 1884" /NCGR_SAMPLE_ID=MMETSP0160_2 /ASSEMBLY_ACC=CAM_ASM_000250 /LENGTH=226 /DNA_ID=CAMNT_0025473419 /DNA_START=90 /DNA_END=770 /DNA_ORIENTATION=-
MAPLRTLAALSLVAGASAFAPANTFGAVKTAAPAPSSTEVALGGETWKEAMAQWNEEYPQLAKWGWGPSVQAEKWNGRHAMFGWVFICATAYAKGHGLIPNPEMTLDLKEWGTLATISGKNTITNERAVILMANVHFFFVGLCATLCPSPFADSLLLDPNSPQYEKNLNAEPFGYMPEFKTGVTEEAEVLNGRLAMLGLITLAGASAIQGKPMIDIVNEWVGGAYY